MTYCRKTMDSPVGELQLIATENGLAAVLWADESGDEVHLGPFVDAPGNPILVEAERQLGAYFAGELEEFDLPIDFKGTQFQKDVWQALLAIPFGQSRTYGEIAQQIGRPKASRAVGAAAGRNPVAIIAPCHRVLGSNGKLTGFRGGLAAKQTLLGIERISHAA